MAEINAPGAPGAAAVAGAAGSFVGFPAAAPGVRPECMVNGALAANAYAIVRHATGSVESREGPHNFAASHADI